MLNFIIAGYVWQTLRWDMCEQPQKKSPSWIGLKTSPSPITTSFYDWKYLSIGVLQKRRFIYNLSYNITFQRLWWNIFQPLCWKLTPSACIPSRFFYSCTLTIFWVLNKLFQELEKVIKSCSPKTCVLRYAFVICNLLEIGVVIVEGGSTAF